LFVPVTTGDPLALARQRHALRDSARELLRRCRIFQLDLLQMIATIDEMYMRVIESGKQQLPFCVQDLGLRTMPCVDFCRAAYGDNAITQDSHCISPGMSFVDGPYLCVGDDEVRCGFGLAQAGGCQEYNEPKNAFHQITSRPT